MASDEVDLLLLDIEMPDIKGTELLKSLENPPLVIFTTAYSEYALEGYDLDVVDYLLKPIRFSRFEKAIAKAKLMLSARSGDNGQKTYLTINVDYQSVKVDTDNILYIEGLKDYVKVYTTDKMLMTRLNLKGIMELLPNDQFSRVHRSYIANLSKVGSYQQSQIRIGETSIPLGKSYRDAVIAKLR